MSLFLVLAFLFSAGSLIGWVLELLFRKFFSTSNPTHRWVNPGFLVGPYLPLYGFSLCVLFLLSYIEIPFIQNPVAKKIALFIVMSIVITFIEYLAGLIFIKGMNIKLWDYSTRWGNIKGIICPLFSFFWILLSAIYYFLIHPSIVSSVYWLSNHLAFSFVVGFFYGIFVIDLSYSLQLMVKIRQFAKEKQIVVRLEAFREHVHQKNMQLKEKAHFILTLKSETQSLRENLVQFVESVKKEIKK